MTEPVLLGTKLYVPRRRAQWVARPRLLSFLDAAPDARLILLSAPPGFGKTGLLAEWIERRGACAAWLTLDPADDDPVRFLSYLVAALQTADPCLGRGLRPLLTAPHPPSLSAALPSLLADLSGLEDDLLLVLDDYHVLSSPAVHDAVVFLLEHLPPRLRLAIATRADPPLPLARIRAAGGLLELRAADLRFTADETASFLNEAMGFSLSLRQLDDLGRRTEGWIAGLQLAALSLRGRDDVDAFIAAFTGSHRFVLDLLSEEVLSRQPADVTRFLLQTSVLDRLSGPLCDAVLERTDGREMLARLEHDNLFVIPLAADRRWYRYHQLFRDLLRARLDADSPDLAPTLSRRAAEWCDTAGHASEALGYALASHDPAFAAGMAERNIVGMLAHNEAAYMARVAALPRDVVRHSPWLSAVQASLLIASARYAECGDLLDAVEAQLPDGREHAELRDFVAALRGYHTTLTSPTPTPAGAAAAATALGTLPGAKMGLRCNVGYWMAYCLYLSGDLAAAERAWLDRLDEDWHHGMTTTLALSVYRVVEIRAINGRLRAAATWGSEWQRRLAEAGHWGIFLPGQIDVGLALVFRAQHRLADALAFARAGVAANRPWPTANVRVLCQVPLAHLLMDTGDYAGAAAQLAEIDASLRGRDLPPDLESSLVACRVRYHLLLGEVDAAREWAERRTHDDAPAGSFLAERDRLSLARVAAAQGHDAEADSLFASLEDGARAGDRRGRLAEILTARAAARWAAGDRSGAEESLLDALALTEPEQAIGLIGVEGERILPALDALALPTARGALTRHGVSLEYLRAVRAAVRDPLPVSPRAATGTVAAAAPVRAPARHPATQPADAAPFVEPLSERELEVLELLGAGLSNRGIAERLIVTVGTVKAHAHRIYGKLGVDGRLRAITRARELALL